MPSPVSRAFRISAERLLQQLPLRRTMDLSNAESEPHFLTGCPHVARFAKPSVSGELEGGVILVAEERSSLVAPIASDDVRVPEIRVRPEDAGGHLFLIGDQVVAAKNSACCGSNDLSGHAVLGVLPDRRAEGVNVMALLNRIHTTCINRT